MKVKFVCENEKYRPQYSNSSDFCMDLKVRIPEGEKTVLPSNTIVFGSGVKMGIPDGYGVKVHARSSTGIKYNCMLANQTAIIDAGYRDEVKIAINNFGKEPITFIDGQRVAQIELAKKIEIEPEWVEDNMTFREGDRGGGIGSTGII